MTDDAPKRRNPRDRYREQLSEAKPAPRATAEGRARGRSVELLPSPEILEGYDAVSPGAAARILAMFEVEQLHRHQWEDQSLKVHALGTVLGQILGFAVMLSVLASATTLGIYGEKTLAAFIAIFGSSAMIWAYIRTEGKKQMYRPMRAQYYEDKDLERQVSREQRKPSE